MVDINLKRKESRVLTYTYNDDVSASEINSAVLTFIMKNNINNVDELVRVSNASFDKSDSANKKVTFVFTDDFSDRVGRFVCELTSVFSATVTTKSDTDNIIISEAIND